MYKAAVVCSVVQCSVYSVFTNIENYPCILLVTSHDRISVSLQGWTEHYNKL